MSSMTISRMNMEKMRKRASSLVMTLSTSTWSMINSMALSQLKTIKWLHKGMKKPSKTRKGQITSLERFWRKMWSLSTFAAAWELRMKWILNGKTCLRCKGSIKLKGCGSRLDWSITLSEWSNLWILRRTSLQTEIMKMITSTCKISPWIKITSGSGISLEPRILFHNCGRS